MLADMQLLHRLIHSEYTTIATAYNKVRILTSTTAIARRPSLFFSFFEQSITVKDRIRELELETTRSTQEPVSLPVHRELPERLHQKSRTSDSTPRPASIWMQRSRTYNNNSVLTRQ